MNAIALALTARMTAVPLKVAVELEQPSMTGEGRHLPFRRGPESASFIPTVKSTTSFAFGSAASTWAPVGRDVLRNAEALRCRADVRGNEGAGR